MGGLELGEKTLAKTIRNISYQQRGASIPSSISLGNEITHHSAAYMLGIFLLFCRNLINVCELSVAAFYLHFALGYGGGRVSL